MTWMRASASRSSARPLPQSRSAENRKASFCSSGNCSSASSAPRPTISCSCFSNAGKSSEGFASERCQRRMENVCCARSVVFCSGTAARAFPSCGVVGIFSSASMTACSETSSRFAISRTYCSRAIGERTSERNGNTTASTIRRKLSAPLECSWSTSRRKVMMSSESRMDFFHSSAPCF